MRGAHQFLGPREAGETAQRLLDQAALVIGVERLAGHLLGREDGQVGDLLADLLQRAPGLGFDVAFGLETSSSRFSLPAVVASDSAVSAALRARP